MEDRIIICKKDGVTISAKFTDRRCNRLSFYRDETTLRVGDIYIGRIESMVPSMNACFVNIGFTDNVYVPFEKMNSPYIEPAHRDGKIHVGDKLLVMIERLPSKNKPASAVMDISLVGNKLVLLQGRKGLSFSKKITDSERREALKSLFAEKKCDNFGLMLRTNAPFSSDEELLTEYSLLTDTFRSITERFRYGKEGTRLYQGLPEYLCFLRDEYLPELSELVTDDPDIFSQVQAYCKQFLPNVSDKVRFYADKRISLYHVYDMKRIIEEATARKVWLKSGASLVFDKTEAMTVIDVNSDKASEAKGAKRLLHQINLEAAEEIMHQLMLRNLSGIIIVDFINTKGSDDEKELLKLLQELSRRDYRRTVAVDITELGLVELTREKREVPISERIRQLSFIP